MLHNRPELLFPDEMENWLSFTRSPLYARTQWHIFDRDRCSSVTRPLRECFEKLTHRTSTNFPARDRTVRKSLRILQWASDYDCDWALEVHVPMQSREMFVGGALVYHQKQNSA